MKLAIGRIVHYHVHPEDSKEIQSNGAKILPAVVVHAWSDTTANLKVLCKGPSDGWKTSVTEGTGLGQWSWPTRES